MDFLNLHIHNCTKIKVKSLKNIIEWRPKQTVAFSQYNISKFKIN